MNEIFMKDIHPHSTTLRRQRSQSGFSLIELLIVVAIIGILVAIIVPTYKNSVIKANETSAIASLTRIRESQINYSMGKKGEFATFDQLLANEFLNERFAGDTPVVDGYVFEMKVNPKSSSAPSSFAVNANPQVSTGINQTGRRFFYIDNNVGNVRENQTGAAQATDPPIGN